MFYKIWKTSLIFFFVLVCLHFLKDITQDILSVPTVLDNLGNIEENINYFPMWLTWLYHWAWVNAFFAELAIILLIPLKFKETSFNKKDLLIVVCLSYILVMTAIAYFLQ